MTPQINIKIAGASLGIAILCCLAALSAWAADSTGEGTRPPGLGKPVGVVQQFRGEVVIIHQKDVKGVNAERGTQLYKGDTIQTLEKGRVRIQMKDGSIISLAPQTKLKLTRSVYADKKKQRSSFLSLLLGKARFLVVKLLDYKHSEFKVKTPTAVCGVRGSDFILETTETETTAIALKDTVLEFQSLAFLEDPPVILTDYQASTTFMNRHPTEPFRMPTDRIEELREQFIGVAPGNAAISDEDAGEQDQRVDDTGVEEAGDLGAQFDLEDARPVFATGGGALADIENDLQSWMLQELDSIKESKIEEGLQGESERLPDFPGAPQ